MRFKLKTKDDTSSINSSLSLSSTPSPPPPSISTSTSLYISPQLTPFSYNYTTPNNFEWPTNHPNYISSHVGLSSIPHWSPSSNKIENLIKSDFSLGPCLNLSETYLNRSPFFHFDSDTNQNEKKNHSILRLGSEKTHEPSRVNSIVPPFSSSEHWFHNRISSGSNQNRVEINETSKFKFGDLPLNKNMLEPESKNDLVQVKSAKCKLVQPQSKDELVLLEPVSQDKLEEPDEPVEKKQNQFDLIRKGKSKVEVRSPLKAKDSGEINNTACEGEGKRDKSGEREEEEEMETGRSDEDKKPIAEILKSWNLRPRKSMKPKAKVNVASVGYRCSLMGVASTRVSKPRSVKSRARPSLERPLVKEKRGFVSTLTKEEIEHDFMQIIGEKPPKKPLKRPKIVQKNLDVLFPGMYLINITPEKYMVNDNPPPLKY